MPYSMLNKLGFFVNFLWNSISRVYTLLGRKPCNLGIQPDVQHGQQHHRLQLHSIGRSFHPPTPLTMYIRLDTCSPV
jgi:hypothetical protein